MRRVVVVSSVHQDVNNVHIPLFPVEQHVDVHASNHGRIALCLSNIASSEHLRTVRLVLFLLRSVASLGL